MGTDFPAGVSSRGIPTEAAADLSVMIPGVGGRVIWVNSTPPAGIIASNNNDGRSRKRPLATLEGAEALATANAGDVVIVEHSHAETWSTAAASANLSKAGVRWVFLGKGALRPTITLGHVDATLTISAASVVVKGFPIIKPSVDSVVAAVTVSAANVEVEIEARDESATVEFVRALLTSAGADQLKAKIVHKGFTAGDAMVNLVRLVGTNDAEIDIDTYGKHSTSVVEFHTTLSTNVKIRGRLYNSGTTDGSKSVVDTVGSSTWDAVLLDATAGAMFSGGSGASLAKDDVSLLYDVIAGTTGIATFPSAAAPANGVSLAEVIRDLWDGVRNGTGGSEPGTNKSIIDAIGFDGAAAVAASAGMLRTMAGTTFVVKKTLTSSAITQAGVDVTGVSSVGDILIEDVVVTADGTGLAAGTNLTLETNNVKGASAFFSQAITALGANGNTSLQAAATTRENTVLESGKKIVAKCTAADCTGAGTIDVYLICKRLADNATLAAA